MVVGTLNLGSEMGLQFKVPTTMRRHGVREAQTWSETEARQSSCSLSCSLCHPLPHMVVGTLHCSILVVFCPILPPVSIPFSLPVWAPVTPCLLMVVGTLNCSPVSLPRFRVPTTILSCPPVSLPVSPPHLTPCLAPCLGPPHPMPPHGGGDLKL